MKDIKLEIAGRKLFFGRAGTFDHIKDVVTEDPFQFMDAQFKRFVKTDDGKWQISTVTEEIIPYAYAGINLQKDIDEEDNVSIEKVKKWVRTLSFEDQAKIINAVVESMISASTNGQAPAGEQMTQPVS